MKVKRFVLMGGAIYYASGGFGDFLASFDTLEEAQVAQTKWDQENADYSWSHVADLEEGTVTGDQGFTPFKGLI